MSGSEVERGFASPEVRSVDASDGVTLLYRLWDAGPARGCVRLVHGLGEHGERYTQLAEALLERGISTVAADLRGHGVSGGRRGHVGRFEDFLSDLARVTEVTPAGGPQILFGHSLGGLIAVRAVQTGQLRGLSGIILSAPALELAEPRPRWRNAAAAVLSRVAPMLQRPNGIDPADLSHEPAAVAAYRSDPLIHDRITPRLFHEMRSAMREASEEAATIDIPVLLLAPGEDRITDVTIAMSVVNRFRGSVRVKTYPGFFHEPLNERDGRLVQNDVLSWIEERLS